ncbi:hypothetical protein OSTOST_15991 [Ostertagia ostertagi]
MFLIVPVLVLFLASVYVQSERTLSPHQNLLPPSMKDMFKKVNRDYNDKISWKGRLAERAVKEAFTPNDTNSRWTLKVQGTREFGNASNLEQKVEKVLRGKMEEKGFGQIVTSLREGTRYGCGAAFTVQ